VSERDIGGLLFTAEMYGVQTDQLAAWLGVSTAGARSAAARWRQHGQADSARLGPGPPWVWLTRDGLAACGLPYAPAVPALSRLAHLRAVTAVRLALEAAPGYAAAGGYWRSERRLRARAGGRLPLREHLPDGEVHWPEETAAIGTRGLAAPGWAGECWAIEAELTPKTVRRTVAIMIEILTRTGDYGCPAAEARMPGRPPRHARVVYVCSAAARPAVQRAREALSTALAARVEIRTLPPSAELRVPRRLAGEAGRTGGVSPPGQPSAGDSGGPSHREEIPEGSGGPSPREEMPGGSGGPSPRASRSAVQ
jgi:hypothetical protein